MANVLPFAHVLMTFAWDRLAFDGTPMVLLLAVLFLMHEVSYFMSMGRVWSFPSLYICDHCLLMARA